MEFQVAVQSAPTGVGSLAGGVDAAGSAADGESVEANADVASSGRRAKTFMLGS